MDEIVEYFEQVHAINIEIDVPALVRAKFDIPKTPITKNLTGVTLETALRQILEEKGLGYKVRNRVLMITAKDTMTVSVYRLDGIAENKKAAERVAKVVERIFDVPTSSIDRLLVVRGDVATQAEVVDMLRSLRAGFRTPRDVRH